MRSEIGGHIDLAERALSLISAAIALVPPGPLLAMPLSLRVTMSLMGRLANDLRCAGELALMGYPAQAATLVATVFETAFTVGLDSPTAMAAAARANARRPLLKLKLDGDAVVERVAAVRAAAPRARLVVDANEAWTPELFAAVAGEIARLGVEMIEQPLPAGDDAALAGLARPVPVCADESCRDSATLLGLRERYA